jgi:TolB-like protein/class 3 adenylate cyclase/cytochrome c-type biogenesis protein CcmH/NrfG
LAEQRTQRRIAAIMFTDIVGYTALMAESEARGLRIRARHRSLLGSLAARYRGEIVDENGDELVVAFPSASDAVNCALAAQAELHEDAELQLRIGIHLGDVVFEGGRIYGDGVNLASRIRPLADPGGICVSGAVYDSVKNQGNVSSTSLGEKQLKNVARPVEVFAVGGTAAAAGSEAADGRPAAAAGWRRVPPVLSALAMLVLAVVLALWALWPRPLGWVLVLSGLSGLPTDLRLPDKPSLVVLPFSNMSGDPDQEYFSDGMTEELTTAFSRNPSLFVIARNSAFTYKGGPVKVKEVGRELGVRYVVEGSVRRAGRQVRITAQLIDATNGYHVWSEVYERDLSDIFRVQWEIAQEIEAALRVELEEAEFERARRAPTKSLDAYDLYLRGIYHFTKFTREEQAEARRLAERLLSLDPNFASGYAMLGATYFQEYAWCWNLDRTLLDRGEELARRAIALGSPNSWPWVLLANIEIYRGRSAEARVAAEKAVQIEPNREFAHSALAAALSQEGRPLAALREIGRALRLNPRHPSPVLLVVGYVNLMGGRDDAALEAWERVRASNPDMVAARVPLAYQYAAQGRLADARVIVQEMLRVNSELTAEALLDWAPPGVPLAEDFVEAMRRVGLP